jgi:transcriptional regulator with PAS, ATPase and Fis domain
MPVLLTGETGTGKEVCARLLHAASARRAGAFIPIDCAAIPNDLMEAELFGYARGAFSGAVQRYDGQLAAAEGGTVFLDEVDDTPPATQAKLLRVLEDRVVSRLGENVWRTVDFRLIAATNRELPALVDAGAFLPDLYQRLAIVTITIPPLRERAADLPALCAHFVDHFYADEPAAAHGARVDAVTPEALAALAAYRWPGNIRELRNVIYQALVYKRAGAELLLSDLPARILAAAPAPAPGRPLVDRAELGRRIDQGALDLRAEVEALERAAVEEALARAGGNAARAAALLGRLGRGGARVPGSTLRAMMRRLGLGARGSRAS